MDFILELNRQLTSLMRPYFAEISLAIVATCLVVYGDALNKALKRFVYRWHFLLRVLVFILMCTFGYGLLTIWLQPFIESLLRQIPMNYQAVFVIVTFSFLGVMAERKRHLETFA